MRHVCEIRFLMTVVIAVAVVSFALPLSAQQSPRDAPGLDRPGLAEMALEHRDRLGLDGAQVARLEAARRGSLERTREARARLSAIREEHAEVRRDRVEERREMMEQRMEARLERMEERREAMQERRETMQERRDAMQERREAMQGAIQDRRDAMQDRRSAIQERREAMREQREDLRGRQRGMRDMGLMSPAASEALMELQQERRREAEEVEAILTSEQMRDLREIVRRERRPPGR